MFKPRQWQEFRGENLMTSIADPEPGSEEKTGDQIEK
jgi:hypothetical protein